MSILARAEEELNRITEEQKRSREKTFLARMRLSRADMNTCLFELETFKTLKSENKRLHEKKMEAIDRVKEASSLVERASEVYMKEENDTISQTSDDDFSDISSYTQWKMEHSYFRKVRSHVSVSFRTFFYAT